MESKPISIVWFKRDLRLRDHEPLQKAIETKLPLLLIFLLEPAVKNAPDWNIRHWQFAYHSVLDLNKQLEKYKIKMHILNGDAVDIFNYISDKQYIKYIFSHQETGNDITFQRDLNLKKLFQQKNIHWNETPSNGVIRGLQNRRSWNKDWHQKMNMPLARPKLSQIRGAPFEVPVPFFMELILSRNLTHYPKTFQSAGETWAHQYLIHFIEERSKGYLANISKPQDSQKHCSRLSAYLAWGNLSIRQVYQNLKDIAQKTPLSKDLLAFKARLHWHCHFIQKFESEPNIEFEHLNKAYRKLLRQPIRLDYIECWKKGTTGFPLVDACMKCVIATGYLNFRMRAMVVSFLTHILWQPWQVGAHHLAQHFLDYEAGIHYPQFQMQAGVTGINAIRIYNPIKQSMLQDAEATFIKTWLPALKNIPNKLVHKPFKMTTLEQQFYHCQLGKDYPEPIIDFKSAYKKATTTLWNLKKHQEVQRQNKIILKRHVSINPSKKEI